MEEPNVDYNIGIFGEGMVGKTCLITRYVDDKFDECEPAKSNVDTYEKTFIINKTLVNLNIFDFRSRNILFINKKLYERIKWNNISL